MSTHAARKSRFGRRFASSIVRRFARGHKRNRLPECNSIHVLQLKSASRSITAKVKGIFLTLAKERAPCYTKSEKQTVRSNSSSVRRRVLNSRNNGRNDFSTVDLLIILSKSTCATAVWLAGRKDGFIKRAFPNRLEAVSGEAVKACLPLILLQVALNVKPDIAFSMKIMKFPSTTGASTSHSALF